MFGYADKLYAHKSEIIQENETYAILRLNKVFINKKIFKNSCTCFCTWP